MGKSGPGSTVMSSSVVASGLSMSIVVASMTSPSECGGMLVAIPTAIPAEPLTSRLGYRAGRTLGSLVDSSKFGIMSTVSLSRSRRSSIAIRVRRDSV